MQITSMTCQLSWPDRWLFVDITSSLLQAGSDSSEHLSELFIRRWFNICPFEDTHYWLVYYNTATAAYEGRSKSFAT